MSFLHRFRRPVALVLLTGASLGAAVLPASASTKPNSIEVADATGDATSLDGTPRCLARTSSRPVSTTARRASRSHLARWRARSRAGCRPVPGREPHGVVAQHGWRRDDRLQIEAVVVEGVHTATVRDAGDKLVLGCAKPMTYTPSSFCHRVSLPRSCFGTPEKVSFSVKPSRNATYRLRYAYAGASGPGFDTVASKGRSIQVAPKVTLDHSATKVASGTTVKLTTKVSPKHAGKEVRLQKRRADGTWKTVQTGKLNAESTRTFQVTASKSVAARGGATTPTPTNREARHHLREAWIHGLANEARPHLCGV
jgi:hypothetical protein